MKTIEKHEWAIQFQGICLMVFIDAGIVEALVDIVQEGSPSSSELCFTLLADILTICAKRLPNSYNEKVQVFGFINA